MKFWQDDAACRGMDPNIFFPEDQDGVWTAKEVCKRCPVKDECLEHAIAQGEEDGIWGGTTSKERGVIIAKRKDIELRKERKRLANRRYDAKRRERRLA